MVVVEEDAYVWHEFKFWTRLVAFHIALIPITFTSEQIFLGKAWTHLSPLYVSVKQYP